MATNTKIIQWWLLSIYPLSAAQTDVRDPVLVMPTEKEVVANV